MSKKLVILHIASITNNFFNGVNVVVPRYVQEQEKYVKVGLLNITNTTIHGIKNQLKYPASFSVDYLEKVFCRPDIVVFHEVYRLQYLSIAKQLQKEKIPYIIYPHGALTKGAQHKKRFKKKLANFFLFGSFIRHALTLQFLSEYESMETISFNVKKVVTINGVDIPHKKKTYNNPKKYNTDIVYIGRLDAYHKGLDLLVEAVSIKAIYLRENSVTIRIYGPDRVGRVSYLKKIIESANVEDLITLSEAVVGAEKEKILLGCDFFIQTSRFEGMPLGILEALSYGIPCLVTKGTTLGEIIEQSGAGWMSQISAESIATTLEQAIRERNSYSEKGERAFEMIQKNFSWEKISKNTVKLYSELLGMVE